MSNILDVSVKSEPKAQADWVDVARIGLVQACMGAVVVTITTTLNRVMVIELALPAVIPGLLVSLHYLIQMIRPRLGYGADQTKRLTPWILAGMATLALGGVLAALATIWLASHWVFGLLSALLGFCMIGIGVSACGTPLLVLLSQSVGDHQKATAATAVWIMMIFGFAITSILSGKFLDPFSFERLLSVSVTISVISIALSSLSMWGLENKLSKRKASGTDPATVVAPTSKSLAPTPSDATLYAVQVEDSRQHFKSSLKQLWRDDQARIFTYFVFSSMLAYSAQDLILEPFAGLIYHYTPGQTTQLSGTLHASVFVGMLLLAFIAGTWVRGRLGDISTWMMTGCVFSAIGMLGLSWAGLSAQAEHLIALSPMLWVLGLGNGLFSIAAISTMMRLSTQSQHANPKSPQTIRPGLKMGLWGAAQAVAFGLGGLVGTAVSDLSLKWMTSAADGYAIVFAIESLIFLTAALMAWRVKKITQRATVHVPQAQEMKQSSTQLTLNAT